MLHFVHFEVYHVGVTERLDLLLPPEGVPANEIHDAICLQSLLLQKRA